LALRGRFAVAQRPAQDVELRVGQIIHFASDLALEVVALSLPSEVLAIEGDGFARHILAGVSSLRCEPRPSLQPGFSAGADALFWHDGLGWVVRLADGDDRPLVAGDTLIVGARTFRAVTAVVSQTGYNTTLAVGGIDRPLRVLARYDSVQVQRDDGPPVIVSGNAARILSELATIGQPISWEALARDLWPDEPDLTALRRRFDSTLARLRQKLREGSVRVDLVRADGSGNFELYLLSDDSVEDQT